MWIDRRWLATGLGLSLLLNFFVIGIIVGHFFALHGHRLPGIGGPLVPAAHVRELTADQKQRFFAAMDRHRAEIQSARRVVKSARRAAEVEIAAPVFDPAKVNADLVAMRQASARLQEAVHGGLIDALADLSPASRAALVAHVPPVTTPSGGTR